MKKWLSTLISIALFCSLMPQFSLPASASETAGKCGDQLTWRFDIVERELIISGSGDMWDYGEGENSPWYPLRESIKTVSLPLLLKHIGSFAFLNCSNLTSVKGLYYNLQSIGEGAFCQCPSLSTIALPDSLVSIGNIAFSYCESLSSITIPDSVTSIGGGAFYTCSRLKSIRIPDGVTVIESSSFQYCHNLRCVTIPNAVKTIEPWAFCYCESLQHVTIPDKTTNIGEGAFAYNSSLKSVTFPRLLMKIGPFAFFDCNKLQDINYMDSMRNWELISIDKEGNDPLLNANLHENYLTSNTRLDRYMSGTSELSRSTVYNNELAIIAANLCLKAGDNGGKNDESLRGYLTWDLGFEDKDIHSKNYGGSLAFTIATKKYAYSKQYENTELMVIVAQGSTTPYEFLKDATARPSKYLYGYPAYDIVFDFYSEIIAEYVAVMKPDTHYKILLTGHSLGGAAANFTAFARTYLGNKKDIYCYTFGAINSISTRATVSEGYENIHNIYNIYDTFSPKQFGKRLPSGMGTGVGKFGHLELYSRDHRSDGDKIKPDVTQLIDSVNHQMHHYLEDVENLYVARQMSNCGSIDSIYKKDNNFSSVTSVIGCPVDVDVFRGDTLVGRVANNMVDYSVTTLDIDVEDDIKIIHFPDDQPYTLKMRAFDEGEMLFFNSDMYGTGATKLITNVALTEGKEFYSEVGGELAISDIKLYVVGDQGEFVAEVDEDGMENPFADIQKGAYYYEPVLWAVNHSPQITNGTSATTFSPGATCTRAQVVTFLWRAMGQPEPTKKDNPFTDVKEGQYYYKAVLWALEKGITTGTSATTFSPNAGCTRGQVVTFLHRAQGTPTPGSSVNPFTDVPAGQYYYDAVMWAVNHSPQITNGTSATTFSPNATCTRGQIVTFLYRSMK